MVEEEYDGLFKNVPGDGKEELTEKDSAAREKGTNYKDDLEKSGDSDRENSYETTEDLDKTIDQANEASGNYDKKLGEIEDRMDGLLKVVNNLSTRFDEEIDPEALKKVKDTKKELDNKLKSIIGYFNEFKNKADNLENNYERVEELDKDLGYLKEKVVPFLKGYIERRTQQCKDNTVSKQEYSRDKQKLEEIIESLDGKDREQDEKIKALENQEYSVEKEYIPFGKEDIKTVQIYNDEKKEWEKQKPDCNETYGPEHLLIGFEYKKVSDGDKLSFVSKTDSSEIEFELKVVEEYPKKGLTYVVMNDDFDGSLKNMNKYRRYIIKNRKVKKDE
mgnify:CR=1 FL=1